MRTTKKESISWLDIENGVNDLVVKILTKRKKYSAIIAINRGGNIPGTMLSYRLNIPLFIYTPQKVEKFDWVSHIDKEVLLIDEIIDGGKTMKKVVKILENYTIKINTCSLYYHPSSIFKPDFYHMKINDDIWLSFPWE